MFASLITRPAVQIAQTRERLFEFERSGHNHINDTSTIPMTSRYIFRFGPKSRFDNLCLRWYGIDPARILPTTDGSLQGQDVTFYLVPAAANFNHNYLGTTKTNEKPCTVKPCYSPDEETLTAQPQSHISQQRRK
jgi:hypothetical protein